MMGVPNSDLQDLERQRLELEGNILKLQESLYHWRTWEAEYDGLREEIDDLEDTATTDDFLQVGRDFGGSLVNEEEVKVILGEKQGITRTRQQAVDLVSRRIDYVRQNVTTMEKRLRASENELHALDSMEQLAEPMEDFPMTEIFEQLDEDGNVISSSVKTPGDQAPELLEVLKKAGVKDVPEAPTQATEVSEDVEDQSGPSEDAKPVSQETPASEANSQPNQDKPAALEDAVTDVDESLEDAELRRAMLQYGLNEVGSVVAELEMDEDGSDVSYDDDPDVFAYDDEEEDEDEYGRSTGRILDQDYHQQMRELEAKLNARGMWNMGKNTGSLPTDVQEELERPQTVQVEKTTTDDKPKKAKKKVAFADDLDIAPQASKPSVEAKPVAPRESDVPVVLDSIVERTDPVVDKPATKDAPKKTSRFKSARNATKDDTPDPTAPVAPADSSSRLATHRASLRKPSASSSPSPALPLFPVRPAEPKPFSQPISDVIEEPAMPRGPKGKITADTLVERAISGGAAAPPEPDELDEQLHRREIASEFYKIRNRMIQQNGGFNEEPEQVPIETEDAPKRVSKFKAARMR